MLPSQILEEGEDYLSTVLDIFEERAKKQKTMQAKRDRTPSGKRGKTRGPRADNSSPA